MKKKLFALGAVLLLLTGLCACGSRTEINLKENNKSDSSVSSSVEDIKTSVNDVADTNETEVSTTDDIIEPDPDAQIEAPTTINSLGDIDGNGDEDFIVIEQNEFGTWSDEYYLRWSLIYNGEVILTKYHELMCNFEAECADLTGDGSLEIFINIYPYVNSMPMEQFVVLKETADGWIELETSEKYNPESYGVKCNAFPIHVYYGEYKNIFDIVCDGFSSFHYDITPYYAAVYEEYAGSELGVLADEILNSDKYSTGDVMGQTCAWGIWELNVTNIDGRDIIVASHGLEGLGGKFDYFGTIDIEFAYNDNWEIEILGMIFHPIMGEDDEICGLMRIN